MTTPDKEKMPTNHRNAGLGRLLVHEAWPHDILGQGGCIASANHPDIAKAIVTACNAYEPMREALILAEKADRIHSKCQECEDGAQAPEACGDCFPSADDARVARRNVLKSLGVRMRDVDRARAIKAEPSICNCSQEDVHDYGPCGEDCRSLVVSTLPVNDRTPSEALTYAIGALSAIAAEAKKDPQLLHLYGIAQAAIDLAKLGPSGCAEMRGDDLARPANDRHHSGSDSIQADVSAPALSEKFNRADEPLIDGWYRAENVPKYFEGCNCWYWDGRSEYPTLDRIPRGYWRRPHHCKNIWVWPLVLPKLPSPPGAELNFSNEAERDAVSLKPDTSSQPAIEAGKLSTDTGEVA